MTDKRPLAGQVAWITGSSRGLGRSMAEELFRLGANVAVHGTRPDSPKTLGEGESMEQVAADVASGRGGETITKTIAQTMATWYRDSVILVTRVVTCPKPE